MLYREELEDDGYEVVSAYSGEEGLEKFKSEMPDLVLLDIEMPGMNGIEALRQMKMKMNNPDVPVILNSAYTEYKQDLGAFASDEYVVTSPNINELKEAICRCLDRSGARKKKKSKVRQPTSDNIANKNTVTKNHLSNTLTIGLHRLENYWNLVESNMFALKKLRYPPYNYLSVYTLFS